MQPVRTVAFEVNGYEYRAIQQNLDKPSRWGQLSQKQPEQPVGGVDDDVKDYGALRGNTSDI
jgi:hypothetical protein